MANKKYVDDGLSTKQTTLGYTAANDTNVVHKTGDETVAGIKTHTSFSITPSSAPTANYQVANKKYVDDGLSTKQTTLGYTAANDSNVVHLTGDETVAGIKTHTSFSITPSSAPTTDYQTANKKYVDDNAGKVGTKAVTETAI